MRVVIRLVVLALFVTVFIGIVLPDAIPPLSTGLLATVGRLKASGAAELAAAIALLFFVLLWLQVEANARMRTHMRSETQQVLVTLRSITASNERFMQNADPTAVFARTTYDLERNEQIVANIEAKHQDESVLAELKTLQSRQEELQHRIESLGQTTLSKLLAELADRRKELEGAIEELEHADGSRVEEHVSELEIFTSEALQRLSAIEGHHESLKQMSATLTELEARASKLCDEEAGLPKLIERISARKDALGEAFEELEEIDDDSLSSVVDNLADELKDIKARSRDLAKEFSRLQDIGNELAALPEMFAPAKESNGKSLNGHAVAPAA